MTTIFFGILLIVGSIALSNFGLWLVRRQVKPGTLTQTHEVGGYLFAAVATLYAVLLGLIVVDALAKYQQAAHETEVEANAVANIFILSEQFPETKRKEVQQLCVEYTKAVVDKEWDILDQRTYAPEARVAALTLVKTVISFKPTTDAENTVYGAAITEACDFWGARRSRMTTAMHGIPAIEWFAVLAGGIATVAFTYFFSLDNLRVQTAMTSMVAFLISMNVFLLWMFGEPYQGSFKVKPDSFNGDLRIFEGNLSSLHPINDEHPNI
jgi:hypothetical protein